MSTLNSKRCKLFDEVGLGVVNGADLPTRGRNGTLITFDALFRKRLFICDALVLFQDWVLVYLLKHDSLLCEHGLWYAIVVPIDLDYINF